MHIEIRRIDPDLPLPARANEHDAGYDLHARQDAALAPAGGRAVIPTGIAVAIPPGHAGFVLPRSGLARRHGVTCLNTPGLIDAGFRGEVCVILVNLDPAEKFEVKRGDRVAQLVVQKVDEIEWRVVDELPTSERGEGGFGSSGVAAGGGD